MGLRRLLRKAIGCPNCSQYMKNEQINKDEKEGKKPSELLDCPIWEVGTLSGSADFAFDTAIVPFKVGNGGVWAYYAFVDMCGSRDIYLKLIEDEPKYESVTPYIDDISNLQRLTGVQYYFDKLNKYRDVLHEVQSLYADYQSRVNSK